MQNDNNYIEDFHSFQKGNEQVFTSIFNMHYKPLLFFASRLLKEEEAAEDAVTSAFTKLWDKRATIEKAEAIKSYLYTAVRNDCLNRIRNDKRAKKNMASIPLHQQWDEPILHHIIEAETLHQIHRACEMLPPQCGKIFRMFYLEGKDYKTIARELNLSIDTVRNQKRRALLIIRSKMFSGMLILGPEFFT